MSDKNKKRTVNGMTPSFREIDNQELIVWAGYNKESELFKENKFRERKVLSVLPFVFLSGYKVGFSGAVWTGKWFKYVNIKERKIRHRFAKFDDGWTYCFYWSKWYDEWYFIKIL